MLIYSHVHMFFLLYVRWLARAVKSSTIRLAARLRACPRRVVLAAHIRGLAQDVYMLIFLDV